MMHLILYDITAQSIRTKIAKRLVAEGYERIQLSVFVGVLNPKDRKPLWNSLTTWLQGEPTAKFYVIRISEQNFENMMTIGKNNLDIPFLLGKRNSIFI